MQNGTFPWVSPSSLAASQKGPWPGYQASLTDLFLKKNPLHQFGSGISQLAAASSYLEKMSTLGSTSTASTSVSEVISHQAQHHLHKCPHLDSKDKPYPCEICQQYSNLCSSGPGKLAADIITTSCSSRMAASDSILENKSSPHLHPGTSSSHSHHGHLSTPSSVVIPLTHPSHHNHPPRRSSSASGSSATAAANRPRHQSNKQFLCPVCHRCFTQKGNLKTHMMIHTGEKPYACQVCGKSFTQKGNVDTHMKIHTGEKDYNCDSCGKRFTQKGNLKTHTRSVHTKEKPFVCGLCGKSFSQKGNMQTHLRTHNKDDRFPCSMCGKTFSQKGNLKTHMQRHSGALPARRYGPRRHSGPVRLHSLGELGSYSGNTSDQASPSNDHHLKSTDDESSSPLEHSIVPSTSTAHQQQLTSPSSGGIPNHEEALSPLHGPLKQAHHGNSNRDSAGLMGSIHSPVSQHQHLQSPRSPSSSPVAMSFGPCSTASRTFYSAPTTPVPTPLNAHASHWLVAAGANSSVMGNNKNRPAPMLSYDNFGISSYGNFAAHHGNTPLSRLSLLSSPLIHGGSISGATINSESEVHKHHSQNTQHQSRPSSTNTPSQQIQQPLNESSTHHQFQQSTANPDFSQLLD